MKRFDVFILNIMFVAPHTGAWIETLHPIKNDLVLVVAPHTGAWIETLTEK